MPSVPVPKAATAALVRDMIRLIADKWTWLVLELLWEHELRFSQVRDGVPGISQKVLTSKLRQMERDGLVRRRVRATIPPQVFYKLTPLGASLSQAFCSVWIWAEQHAPDVERARRKFREKPPAKAAGISPQPE